MGDGGDRGGTVASCEDIRNCIGGVRGCKLEVVGVVKCGEVRVIKVSLVYWRRRQRHN